MRYLVLAATLFSVGACKDATGPRVDPTALVRNTYSAAIYWYWFDGTSITGGDTIPAFTTRCERFLARPDSARFDIVRSDTIAQPNGWNVYTSNYFDPAARDFWTVTSSGPSPLILVNDTTAAPC